MAYRFLYLLTFLVSLFFSMFSHADNENLSSCRVNETQQAWLERVNQARGQVRQCGDESFKAVEALVWNCQLEAAAQAHSKNMAKNDFFSHSNPAGEEVGERVSATNYTWRAVGENIAAGQGSLEAVIEGWLSSPGHCANIMSERFTEMGMASVKAPNSKYSPYWTQIFGRPR